MSPCLIGNTWSSCAIWPTVFMVYIYVSLTVRVFFLMVFYRIWGTEHLCCNQIDLLQSSSPNLHLQNDCSSSSSVPIFFVKSQQLHSVRLMSALQRASSVICYVAGILPVTHRGIFSHFPFRLHSFYSIYK